MILIDAETAYTVIICSDMKARKHLSGTNVQDYVQLVLMVTLTVEFDCNAENSSTDDVIMGCTVSGARFANRGKPPDSYSGEFSSHRGSSDGFIGQNIVWMFFSKSHTFCADVRFATWWRLKTTQVFMLCYRIRGPSCLKLRLWWYMRC